MWDKGILQGKVVRPMRIVDPEQEDYCGLVQVFFDESKLHNDVSQFVFGDVTPCIMLFSLDFIDYLFTTD